MTTSAPTLLQTDQPVSIWERPWVLSLILLAITVAVFWPVAKCSFIDWDDWRQLAENPAYSPVNWHAIGQYWFHGFLNLYAPLTYTIWAAIAWVNQQWTHQIPLSPGLFHLANLAAHLVAVEFVFLLLRRLVGQSLPAFVGALIFAIHPLQVEPIAWVGSFNTLVCGALTALTLWLYVSYAQAPNRSAAIKWYVGSCVALLAALFAKPMAISAVVMALAIDALILRRGFRQYYKSIIIWAILTVPFILIGRAIQPAFASTQTPFWTRPLVAGDTTAFYLFKLVWPAHLTLDYQRTPVYLLRTGQLWWTWLLPAAVLAAGIIWRKKWPLLLGGFAVMIAGILPISGIVGFYFQKFSTVADRYMYLGMIGVAIAVAGFVVRSQRSRARSKRDAKTAYFVRGSFVRGLLACIVVLAIFALAIRSHDRVWDWRNSLTITANAQRFEENSAIAFKIRAFALAKLGRYPEAIDQYRRSLKFDPGDFETRYNFANLLYSLHDYPDALKQFQQAIAQAPKRSEFHYNYAVALMAVGQSNAAGEQFRLAVELNPKSQLAQQSYAKWKAMARVKEPRTK